MVIDPERLQQFRPGEAEFIAHEAVEVDGRYAERPADIPEGEARTIREGRT